MQISFVSTGNQFYIKLRRSDGKFAKVQLTKNEVVELNNQITAALPELAVHEGIKSALERFTRTITRVETGQWKSTKKNQGSESIFTPGLDDC